MIEIQWGLCNEPEQLLYSLRARTNDRCLRLFACACCRQVWPLIVDERSRKAVLASERFADGLVSSLVLKTAEAAAQDVRCSATGGWLAAWAAAETAGFDASVAAAWVPTWAAEAAAEAAARSGLISDNTAPVDDIAASAWRRHRQLQCELLRDIYPDPFIPMLRLKSSWLRWKNGIVEMAAQECYDGGRCEDLSRLAHLLMQAGCDNQEILAHCRAPMAHVRGCWVLDLLLGKRGQPRREKESPKLQWSDSTEFREKYGRPSPWDCPPPASAQVLSA